LDPHQGRASVHVDGRRIAIADGFTDERTHDHVLWHVLGLKPGPHTLQIVPTGTRHTRSDGTGVALEGAVIYDDGISHR